MGMGRFVGPWAPPHLLKGSPRADCAGDRMNQARTPQDDGPGGSFFIAVKLAQPVLASTATIDGTAVP